MDSDLAYSREQKAVDQLGDLAEDRHRFLRKKILLTGESELLSLQNGRECFLNSVRLAVRICPNVAVHLSRQSEALRGEAEDLAGHIAFGKKVEFLHELKDFNQFDACGVIGWHKGTS